MIIKKDIFWQLLIEIMLFKLNLPRNFTFAQIESFTVLKAIQKCKLLNLIIVFYIFLF